MSESITNQPPHLAEERKVVLGDGGYETHVYKGGNLVYVDSFDDKKDLPPEIGSIFPEPDVSQNAVTPDTKIESEEEKAQRINELQKQRNLWRQEAESKNQPAKKLYNLELIRSD